MSFNRDFFSDAFNSSADDFFRDREDFRRSRRPDMTRFMDSPFSSMGFTGRPSAMNGFRDSRLPGGMFAGSEIPIPVIRQRRRNTNEDGDNHEDSDAKQMDPNESSTANAADELIDQEESKHEAKIQPRVHHIPIKVETRDESASSASPSFSTAVPPLSRSSSNASQASARSSSSGHSLYHNQHRSESPFSSTSSVHQRVASPSMHSPVSNCSGGASGEEHIIPIKIERGVEPIRKQACTSTSPLPKAAKQAKSASPSPGLTQSTRSHRTPTPTMQREGTPGGGPYVTRINVHEREPGPVHERKQRSAPIAQDAMTLIAEINREISALEAQINSFTGEHQDKQYRYLDEMLTRCMLKLDSIEVEGRDDVRHARKAALSTIDKCLNILDSKAAKNKSIEEKMGTIDDQQTMVNNAEKETSAEPTESADATAISGEENDDKRNSTDPALTDGQQISESVDKSSVNDANPAAADEDKQKIFESSV